MSIAFIEGLPEWIEKPLYSGWSYAALGFFFFIIFIWGLFRLFSKSNSPVKTAVGVQAEPSFDYAPLLNLIGKPNGRTKNILLAAGSLSDLPVTVSVHTAIQLAASSKCLLIDLDTKRDALACVFDITPDKCPANLSPIATPVENLHIWPAHYFSRVRQMDLKAALAWSENKYDIVLLNAPYLATHPDRGRIIRCAESAVIFAHDKANAKILQKLLAAGPCRVLKMLNLNGQPMD